jgi:PAS domain S-box-containing protein
MDPDFLVGQLRTMLIHAQEAVSIVDAEGRVIVTSGRLRGSLGYDTDSWNDRTLLELVRPHDSDRAGAMRERVLSSPGVPITEEFLVSAADGHLEAISVRAVNLLDDPAVRGVVIAARNLERPRRGLWRGDIATVTRELVDLVDAVDVIDARVLNALVDGIGDRAVVVEVVIAFLGVLDRRIASMTDSRERGESPPDDVVASLVASCGLLGLARLSDETLAYADGGRDSGSLTVTAADTREALVRWVDGAAMTP